MKQDTVEADVLTTFVAALFVAAGASGRDATIVARSLVESDLQGQASHGVMLVDMYVDRLLNGSIAVHGEPEITAEKDGVVVLDGKNVFGQTIGDAAVELAVDRARRHGCGVVAVKHGFHFGVARRYALAAAREGCVGIAMCNTRPLMPAPGGAERIVGNNPLAIAIPTAGEPPLVFDMATSEAAMGKIRMAAKTGAAIPSNWAVKADGSPTMDPNEAIEGMLLPCAGPKGFGLSFMIDMMCGLLSGGAHGAGVQPLYGDPRIPYDCSLLFVAIDVPHFRDLDAFKRDSHDAAEKIRAGRRAPGVARLYAPGEPEWDRAAKSGGKVALEPAVLSMLERLARKLNVAPVQVDEKGGNDGEA